MKMMKKRNLSDSRPSGVQASGEEMDCSLFGRRKWIGLHSAGIQFTVAAIAIPAAVLLALGGCRGTETVGRDRQTSELILEDRPADISGRLLSGEAADVLEDAPAARDKEESESNHSVTEPKAKTSSAKKKINERYHVGDVIEDGDMKVLYAACGEYREESEYQQPEPGYKYIFLEFAFENTSKDRDRSISFWSFKCYADGYEAQSYFGGEDDLAPSISSGRMAMGKIYFSVPKEAKEIEVEYQPNYVPSEKLIFVYEGEKNSGKRLSAKTKPTEGALVVGETVETDIQKITYISCEKFDPDNVFVQPAKGCTYYSLTFEVENLTGSDMQVTSYDFTCYADGYRCSSTLLRDDYLSADLASGRKTLGTVTFAVPDNAKTVEAEYPINTWTDEHITFTIR